MCFKNLPIDFDAEGKAFLKDGAGNPYSTATAAPPGVPKQLTAERVAELVKRNGHVKDVDFDPVTRVAGALAFHTVTDVRERKVPDRLVDWKSVIPGMDEAIEFFLAHAPSGDPMRDNIEGIQKDIHELAELYRKP